MKKKTILHYALPTILLTILTGTVVIAFYANHPRAELLPDTWSYLYVADRIANTGQLVNTWRLPIYPLFISTIYAIAGQGNIEAVSSAQAILFILATLEIYTLAALIFQRRWLAFILGLLVGANLTLLSYVKPLMSEGMGLWLLTSLVLTTLLFMKTFRRRLLWLIAFWMLLLFMTRPEWLYLPPLLFAYILLLASWKHHLRRLLPHALAALLVLYSIVGGYIFINATQNNFVGTTWITNINLLGKVLQYNMQDHSDPSNPQYVAITHMLDSDGKKNIHDPYFIMGRQPAFFADNLSTIAKYSEYIILHHPKTFILKTVPLFFSSLTAYAQESGITTTAIFAHPLSILHQASYIFYSSNGLFPLFALFWLALFCFKRYRQKPIVQIMGLLILICIYGIVLTTTGGYRDYDYMRIYVLFDPLLIIIIWGTLLGGLALLLKKGSGLQLFPAGNRGARTVFLSCCCLLVFILSGCQGDLITPSSNHSLVLVSCHREDRVGLLFMRFDNRGADLATGSMLLHFTTVHSKLHVTMKINLPDILYQQERLVTIDVPTHGSIYWMPTSPVKVVLQLPVTSKQTQATFTMDCHDLN
ncbi:hypothetical protein [Dictyobacter kobayashii]|uniref:Glycosyltransferase RgtA/B/C/D-like domain-containing protein n=1 Tax=Dictyobacter kobayashii TaxID=2014872 RepID=A0A402AY70_9CHLR|nr:hypothetical protein [Dictyobacter kobayashii]GCE24080.1 hypothetical protein KDK_78800 [Dictyobacter kobayashii]